MVSSWPVGPRQAEPYDHDPGPRRALYNLPLKVVDAILVAVGAAIWFGYAVVLPTPALRAVCGVITACLLFLLIRICTSGIFVRKREIVVRGFGRTYKIDWANVEGFTQVSASPINRSVYVAVVANGGKHLKTAGLTAPRDGTMAMVAIGELNEQWAIAKANSKQHGGPAAASSPHS